MAGARRFHAVFTAAADAYDAFMGRYSGPLAPLFCDFAGVDSRQRVLDVGCGPGALVTELVTRVGAENVSAVDPAAQFVEATRERNPGVDVSGASAERLPFDDLEFDASLAQLVVHFMSDPVGGLSEIVDIPEAGLFLYKVNEERTQKPDADQIIQIENGAFQNWYGEKKDAVPVTRQLLTDLGLA